jgi:hypothetical protein
MSFRLFAYYCAVAGGWSGFLGWLLGILLATSGGDKYFESILRISLMGMFLGVSVAFGLSLLDAGFNLTFNRPGAVFLRVSVATVIGLLGGLFGSFVGGSLYYATSDINYIWPIFYVTGWMIVGFLIGLSIGLFEIVSSLFSQQDVGSAFKKGVKCLGGGTLGGLLGGVIALIFRFGAGKIAGPGVDVDKLWCPIATGFIAIGASIGLLVGLAQIILKEAWIKVEAGFRPGREMFLAKQTTTIGRAEGSDIALFGDASVEKNHANIVKQDGRYYLEDLQSPGGTYLNERRIQGKAALSAGDMIRVGNSVLRFHERTKRKE